MNSFEYAKAKDLSQALEGLQKGATLKAGGIDLLDLMKEGVVKPSRMISIRDLPELREVSDKKDGTHIGAGLTLAELASDPTIRQVHPALAMAAENAATPQIRNAATLGGNLCQRPRCWYFRNENFNCSRKGGKTCFAIQGENENHAIIANQDGCAIVHPSAIGAALTALEATIRVVGPNQERDIPIDHFFVLPNQDMMKENILEPEEIITEIILPHTGSGSTSYYYKQKHKQTFDWPLAEVAVYLEMDQKKCNKARIVLGAAAPIPWRATMAEHVLRGQEMDHAIIHKASKAAIADATPLSQNQHKVAIFQAAVRRTLCWAAGLDPFEEK